MINDDWILWKLGMLFWIECREKHFLIKKSMKKYINLLIAMYHVYHSPEATAAWLGLGWMLILPIVIYLEY